MNKILRYTLLLVLLFAVIPMVSASPEYRTKATLRCYGKTTSADATVRLTHNQETIAEFTLHCDPETRKDISIIITRQKPNDWHITITVSNGEDTATCESSGVHFPTAAVCHTSPESAKIILQTVKL